MPGNPSNRGGGHPRGSMPHPQQPSWARAAGTNLSLHHGPAILSYRRQAGGALARAREETACSPRVPSSPEDHCARTGLSRPRPPTLPGCHCRLSPAAWWLKLWGQTAGVLIQTALYCFCDSEQISDLLGPLPHLYSGADKIYLLELVRGCPQPPTQEPRWVSKPACRQCRGERYTRGGCQPLSVPQLCLRWWVAGSGEVGLGSGSSHAASPTCTSLSCLTVSLSSPPSKTHRHWNSLAVQRLGLHASTAGGTGSIPGRGAKIPHAVWHSPEHQHWDFPGGAGVKNPPANAGDTGSSPGPGRSHMLRSN